MADLKVKIAPSILSADFSRLADEIKKVEDAGADLLHVDVMDGHFVDNLTIGLPVVEAIKKNTKLPLDVHLMIRNPGKYATRYVDAGAGTVTFHVEAVAFEYCLHRGEMGYSVDFLSSRLIDFERANRIIDEVQERGARAGVSVNPGTMVEVMEGELVHRVDQVLVMTVWPGFGGQKFMADCLPKVKTLRRLNPAVDVEVDGGVNPGNAGQAAAMGANVLVAGTAVFRSGDVRKAIEDLRTSAESAFVAKPR